MTIPEAAVQWAVNIANDQSHGYSQASRWGNPDYDCSSFAISAYKAAGVPIDTAKVNYTGNMQNLTQYGFKDVTSKVNLNTGNGLQRGDILWWHKSGNQGHTAIYIGNNQIVHARGQSYGSPKTGDQGSEIAVTPVLPWFMEARLQICRWWICKACSHTHTDSNRQAVSCQHTDAHHQVWLSQ